LIVFESVTLQKKFLGTGLVSGHISDGNAMLCISTRNVARCQKSFDTTAPTIFLSNLTLSKTMKIKGILFKIGHFVPEILLKVYKRH
jgi:hypothetical protein